MLKRVLSWLLVFAMVCSMLPVNAMAVSVGSDQKPTVIQTETVTMINPLYADLITLEDLALPEPEPAADSGEVAADAYAATYEEAAAQLREGMKQRKPTIEVYYQTDNHNLDVDGPAIWEGSFTHTGEPTEGDYLKWVWAGCSYGASGYVENNVYYLTYTFTLGYHSTAEQEAELDAAVETLLSDLNPTGTDYQKFKTVYDYICANITYDHDSEGMLKHTAYAALVNKTAVCQGYAVLLYRLALEMGIDNRLVSGTGNGGAHGWNIVELNDVYYNADSTWDATWMQKVGYYNYFLQCEETFTEGGTDHIRDAEYDTAEFHAAYPMSSTNFNPETDDVADPVVAEGTCGDTLTWALTEDGVLTISGEGEMYDFEARNAPWEPYQGQITSVAMEEGITGIGEYAFLSCAMSSVVIPEGVTDISAYAFLSCENLTKVDLPDSLVTLGDGAFGLSGLTEITLGANVKTIGNHALLCEHLAAIHVDEANMNFHDFGGILYNNGTLMQVPCAYTGTVEPINDATLIAPYAFSGCQYVEEVVIHARILELGEYAFSGCTGLKQIHFQGDVPTFGNNVFDGVTAVADYPAANTYWTDEGIPQYGGTITWTPYGTDLVAYGICGEYERINDGMTAAPCGDNATWVLTSDGILTISGTGKTKDCHLGGNHPWGVISMNDASRIRSVVVEEGITYLGSFFFVDSIGAYITELSLPSTLTAFADAACYAMYSLETVNIPEGVTALPSNVFSDCHALRSLDIPGSVTTIGEYAMHNCTTLTKLWFHGDAPTIASNAFGKVTATAYYPADNATWTSDVMQNYGGTITWVSYNPGVIAEGTCGDTLTWVITNDGVLTISGEGAMDDYDFAAEQFAPWYDHRELITEIVVEDGVTHIGMGAFYGTSAVSLTMANSVQSLGGWSCAYMVELTTVNLPEGLTSIGEFALGYTQGLTAVVLPDSLTEIGAQAFEGSGITEITIPASVETIGARAFVECPKLTAIHAAEGGQYFSKDGMLFDGLTLVQVPGGYADETLLLDMMYIGEYALSGCQNVTAVTVSGRVLEVSASAFANCPALEVVHFQSDPPKFGETVFNGTECVVEYPCANTFWTDEVKQQCAGTITWTPYGTDLVAEGICGENDPNLDSWYCGTNVTWTLTSDGTMTFSGTGRIMDCGLHVNHPWYLICNNDASRITGIVIEEGITYAGNFLFYGALGFEGSIKTISLPSTLAEIGGAVFSGAAITELVLPENLTAIGPYAFTGCPNLERVRIPANVTVLGEQAFTNCDSLTAIEVDPENTAFYSDLGVLYSADHVLITLPGGYEGAYQVLDGTTAIESDAASKAKKLTQIVIPDSVKTIGGAAFFECTRLTTVDMGNGVTTFGGQQTFAECSSLTDIKLSNSLTSLYSYTFYDCDALTKITIPASVTEMGDYAFWKSDNVSEIIFAGNAPTFQSNTFNSVNAGTAYYPADNATWTSDVMQNYGGTITWVSYNPGVIASGTCGENVTWALSQDGVLTISGTGDMDDYSSAEGQPWKDVADSIVSVQVEGTVNSIGAYSFYGLDHLTSVVIGDGVTAIGGHSMKYCPNLASVVLPASVMDMGVSVFAESDLLTSAGPVGGAYAVQFGWTESVPDYAFNRMDKLDVVVLPDSLKTIGENAFLYCTALTSIELPEGLTEIGAQAFESSGLAEITFPTSVEVIGLEAFEYCPLVEVNLPEKLKIIDTRVFHDCDELKKVVIPSSVEEIALRAFWSCDALQTVIFEGDVPQIQDSAFDNTIVVAYYPANNETWTEDVMQNYGGTITWVPYGSSGLDVLTVGEVDALTQNMGDGWRFEPATNVLYLYGGGYEGSAEAAIYAEGDLTIFLEEGTGSGFYGVNNGVLVKGNLTITGGGHMLATASASYGNGGSYGPCGIYVTGNLTLDGTNVTTEADCAGIGCEGSVMITDSTVNSSGARNGIFTNGNLRISNSTVDAHSTSVVADNKWDFRGRFLMGIVAQGDNLTIENGSHVTVSADQFGVYALDLTVEDSTLNASATLSAIMAENLFSVTGASNVHAVATLTEEQHEEYGEEAYAVLSNGEIRIGEGLTLVGGEIGYQNPDSTQLTVLNNDGTAAMDVSIVPLTVVAEGTCGENLTWVLTNDGVLTISGEGAMEDYTDSNRPWQDHNNTITAIVVEEGVTTIGDYAFWMTSAETISLPDTLTSIGDYAICWVPYLTELTIPESVTELGVFALAQLFGLKELAIPASVTSIGDGAFCSIPLERLTVAEGNANYLVKDGVLYRISRLETQIGSALEAEDYILYEQVHTYLYSNTAAEFVIPETVMEIAGWAFYNENLTSVTIPSNVTSIGESAFCSGTIQRLTFQGNMPTMAENALSGNTMAISYPAGNATWTDEARAACGDGITWEPYGDDTLMAYGTCGENAEWILDTTGKLTVFGEGAIDNYAWMTYLPWVNNYFDVTFIEVGSGITDIGQCAFMGTFGGSNVTGVKLNEGLKSIGDYAFSLQMITEITIPSTVEKLGLCAFYYAPNLEAITFTGDAPAFAEQVFGDNAETLTAYYPANNPTWTEDVLQDYGGTVTWVPYGEEEAPIVITTQPVDYVGMVGETASFTVAAEGEGLTYQWYYFDKETNDWKKSGSGTSATLEVEFKAYRNNQQYRCVITDAEGNTVTTDTVRLVAREMNLVITAQPVSYVGSVNDDVVFTVDATGNGLVYQWYYSDDDGATWKKSGSPGFDTAILTPVLRAYRDGYQFYCQITDVFGNTVTSDVVSMVVKTSDVVITQQPQDVEMAILSQLYQFTVEATGDNLTYRWEVSTDGGETWELSWNQGYESATLNVRMNANRDGNMYRCVITSGLKTVVTSEPALLDLQDPSVELVSQSGSVTAVAGTTVSFRVEATGNDLTYAWYRSNDKGTTWDLTYLSGYDTDTLSFVANANRAAMYKCKITDGSGKAVWSTDVKLQVLSAELKILTQPESVTCASGETASFTVKAQGDTLKYQWYASADGGETWTETYLGGYNTETLSFVVNASRAAKLYKCVITDAVGNKVETDAVSVTIR